MDDNRFDDIIKGKVGEYTDPTFDEGAIAGLHNLIAANPAVPWYVGYKNVGLMAATLAVFTMINWMLINEFGNNSGDLASIHNAEIIAYKSAVEDLKGEIQKLQSAAPDTIYITQANAQNLIEEAPRNPALVSSKGPTEQDIIAAFLTGLQDENEIASIAGFYFFKEDALPQIGDLTLEGRNVLLASRDFIYASSDQDTIYKDAKIAVIKPDKDNAPLVVIRNLEKHYSKGIGLKLGVETEFAASSPDYGKGEGLPGIGLMAELVLSPSLGLETGFKYKTRSYAIDDPDPSDLSSYPGIDNTLGPLADTEVDARLFEIPINLKYYTPISQNNDWYVSLGISPNLYFAQGFEYGHEFQGEVGNAEVDVTNKVDRNQTKLYLGTLNAGTGFNFDINNKRSFQLGAFYQRTLKDIGFEERSFNVFGAKASYWFRVK
ncbi:MAG: outer membrane beta-barrel protein [Cyclobacteriaceae bacterium]